MLILPSKIYILYIDFKNVFKSIASVKLLIVMEDIGYQIDAVELVRESMYMPPSHYTSNL